MASQLPTLPTVQLPPLPAKHEDFISYIAESSQKQMHELIEPYNEHDSRLREIFAQQPEHPNIAGNYVVPLFNGDKIDVKIRARNLDAETVKKRESYLLPLDQSSRKANGSHAVVQSLEEFQTNFNIFSESSLVDMDWSNVVVAGSAALTPLLPVPDRQRSSKRALRKYYHEKFAPASDVDLFLYGLTGDQAVEKIKQIENRVRNSILTETTTVRTKNTITIASQYPIRHIQIVLRIYRSISEILVGFDVDCSCVAYDGRQVYASPRALAACITQTNTIDLTRRSPSYENRLSKYSHRGFEVHWPQLDRSKVDPTIFERSFRRVVGLARLLVLEKLPTRNERDLYMDQRREERGRPPVNRPWQFAGGNIKDKHEDEVADWADEEDVSNYHTLTIPYGPKYHARKIEKLLFKKDLLLNAEWNKKDDRKVNLHRHPAFFGSVEDVMHDCCGYCPKPVTSEEQEVAKDESKRYISGELSFMKDDPGRQAIGSFFPLTNDDWTEMAYVGNTANLCNAIVNHDLEAVEDWLNQENSNPNCRDHTGRTPLHLAVMCSTPEIVQCIINHGARIVARLADGKTALHLAAMRGNAEMVAAILRKSEANEEEESKRTLQKPIKASVDDSETTLIGDKAPVDGSDIRMIESSDLDEAEGANSDEEGSVDATTDHSYVKVKQANAGGSETLDDAANDDPDIYDVNVVAWDIPVSALHLAVVKGHIDVVKVLISEFGANPLLPVKIEGQGALLTLALALFLPMEEAREMIQTLLELGASLAQADINQVSPLHYVAISKWELLKTLLDLNRPIAEAVLDHLACCSEYTYIPRIATPLYSVILQGNEPAAKFLLEAGAKPQIKFSKYWDSKKKSIRSSYNMNIEHEKDLFSQNFRQPIIIAMEYDLPNIVSDLIIHGVDVNMLDPDGLKAVNGDDDDDDDKPPTAVWGQSLLDMVRGKIQKLEKYEGKKDDSIPPRDIASELGSDDQYLKGYEAGTYAHWAISKQVIMKRSQYLRQKQSWDRQVKRSTEKKGLVEKQAAIRTLLEQFRRLETEILERGAKTFKEMHPECQNPIDALGSWQSDRSSDKPPVWRPSLTFRDNDSIDEVEVAYRKLFQACWEGNVQSIKSFTLAPWKTSGKTFPPLKVATSDYLNFSTFHICVLRGHREAAKTVLEIARIQYAPKEKKDKIRYFLAEDGGDDESSLDGCNDIEIQSEIVDDQFTIEEIGDVHLKVESHVAPLTLIGMPFLPYDRGEVGQFLFDGFKEDPGVMTSLDESLKRPKEYETPENLFQVAVMLNDQDLLSFLLDLVEDQARRELPGIEEEELRFTDFSFSDFYYMVKYGQVEMVPYVIQRTGAGLPIDAFVKDSGVETKEEHKYYQGLTIHGKKRPRWARDGRDANYVQSYDTDAPLLLAALQGRLSMVKWFQSVQARDSYSAFARKKQGDKRFNLLAQSKYGIDKPISLWLDHHSHLLMHIVVMGRTTTESLELLRYLISTKPALMQAKSLSGQTPLHLAFSMHRHEMSKLLIAAGADQTCCDKSGNNLIHAALIQNQGPPRYDHKAVEAMLSLIDPALYSRLATERSFVNPGFATPLASWLHRMATNINHGYWNAANPVLAVDAAMARMVRTLLSFSRGVELNLLNGEGDTPLHTAIRHAHPLVVAQILTCASSPESKGLNALLLLNRESATGRTPYEMAEDRVLQTRTFAGLPVLPGLFEPGRRYAGPVPEASRMIDGQMKMLKKGALERSPASFVAKKKREDIDIDIDIDHMEDEEREVNPEDRESEDVSEAQKVWETCQRFVKKLEEEEVGSVHKKRKLVSLLEANEIAKRLALRVEQGSAAARRRERVDGEDDEGEDEGKDVEGQGAQDEVWEWYHLASLNE